MSPSIGGVVSGLGIDPFGGGAAANERAGPLHCERCDRLFEDDAEWWNHGTEACVRHLLSELARLREQYSELIYAVARKHPDESRHQTALRYIQQAEQGSGEASALAQPEEEQS